VRSDSSNRISDPLLLPMLWFGWCTSAFAGEIGFGKWTERAELLHAPPATGVRFSGAGASELRGGKSVDCSVTRDICCDDGWREAFESGRPPLGFRGGEMGDIVRELFSEWS